MEKQDIPMIPKHQAEKQMMHMSWTIRWLVIAIVIGFMCMVGMAYIFVSNYTSRTERWINTYNQLVTNITEVLHENEETGNVQQPSLP